MRVNYPGNPKLRFYKHHTGGLTPQQFAWLAKTGTASLEHLYPGHAETHLYTLRTIDISLISDAAISKPHALFFSDPSPTDVITFPHGEILISTETAREQAPAHQHSTAEETLLYLIHGLLHLAGYDDLTEQQRSRMHILQEKVLHHIVTLHPPS